MDKVQNFNRDKIKISMGLLTMPYTFVSYN
jgi:hypothetical protein